MGGSRAVGAVIRQRRIELELEIAQLAEEIGVTPATMSGIETGHKNCSLEKIRKLAFILKLDSGDLCAAFGKRGRARPTLVQALAHVTNGLRWPRAIAAIASGIAPNTMANVANIFVEIAEIESALAFVDDCCELMRQGAKVRVVGASLKHRRSPILKHIIDKHASTLASKGIAVEYFWALSDSLDERLQDILFELETKVAHRLLSCPFMMSNIEQSKQPNFPFDVVVLGDVGALLSFPIDSPQMANSHIGLRGNVGALADHTRLVRQSSVETVKVIAQSNLLEFLREYHQTEAENADGPRYMVQRFVGDYSRSPRDFQPDSDWYLRIIARGHTSDEIREISSLRQRILGRSRDKAASNEFKQLCSRKAMEVWALTGQRPGIDPREIENPSERLRRLEQLLTIFQQDGFSIAFVEEDIADEIGWTEVRAGNEFSFVVQGKRAVVLEMTVCGLVSGVVEYQDIYSIVRDRSFVSQIFNEFETIWDAIPGVQKSRESNLKFLGQLRAMVPVEARR